MKIGKSLVQLAQEVQRQNESKKDYIADTRAIRMTESGALEGFGSALTVRDVAHGQLAGKLNIPKPYYDRMRTEAPGLLAQNVNHWFAAQPSKSMVRTLDGAVRGILSDRYRAMDNFDLLQTVLPVLQMNRADFKSCEITERHLFLKVTFPDLVTEVPGSKQVGDVVEAGLSIRNSEIGFSAFAVEPFFFRRVCTNGMISNYARRSYHVGKKIAGAEDAVEEILRDETRDARDRAFWMQIQDVVQSSISRDVMAQHVARFADAAQQKLSGDIPAVVEAVRRTFNLSEAQGGGILQHLISDGDLSRWGLANAVTRTAQDQEDYEKATELERLGGRIIELEAKDWKALAA